MPKYILPGLPYDYGALEPHVSGRIIMELHHDQDHDGYVKGANEDSNSSTKRASRRLHAVGDCGAGAALVWEPVGSRLLTTQIYDHQSNLAQGGIPLMVLDAWEHAYYLQYETSRSMAPRPGSPRG